ncbi:M16 family metallopeptidase [Pseudohongiella spirulinae]|uniref:Peptidase M16 inactive domain family n=1 Tax=Pseudohongiella spirulinae TaxID=1249552 RepID=A0A0S2KB74_9GAMM|nr:M16 family metallopeptidase [Pseudohongiella spirulinae]ALO45579.1 Peptidase M16 inactive domain family [Pseudohongiella spirulinae]
MFQSASLTRRLFTTITAICALLIVACSPQQSQTPVGDSAEPERAQYTRIYPPNPDDPLGAHIFELNNGLRVYLSRNPEEPRFYAEIAVRAGSKHDPADATGLAHYLEHLLFKGNTELGTLDFEAEKVYLDQIVELYERHFNSTDPAERAEIYAQINATAQQAAEYAIPNEFDKLYSSMGASGLNAHTWHEETVYKVGLPANRLAQWAAIESDRFINPVFRLFHTELEVVYEEKNRTLDNRDRISYYALADLLYKNHPYGQQTTIGDAEHLKNPSLVYIQEYFDTYYVPNNMAIFISGDIDIDQTIQLIADNFSRWQAKPLPPAQSWDEEPIADIERVTVTYPGQEEVQMAFRTVPNGHADKEALMLLDMILDNRTAGLINLNLNQRQRVQAAGSSPEFHNDYGSQRLWGVPREGQTLEEVEGLLLEQLEIIKRGEFEDWILPAIVNDFKAMDKRALESNTARVAAMRQAFLQHSDWNTAINQIRRLERVTKQDVIDVANKYFTSNNYVAVHRLNGPADIPPVEKPQIDPIQVDPSRQSEYAAAILAMPYDDIEPRFLQAGVDYQIAEFSTQVPLYYARNQLNDLFTFSINIDVGTEEYDLLSLVSALIDKAGTPDYPAEELQKQWYRLGSNFSFNVGANEMSISISGMDPQFEESLALMLSLLRDPQSDEQTLRELKSTILQSRRDQRENPQAISQALYLFNRYGDESPMLRTMSSAQIQAVELDQLLEIIPQLLGYRHTLSYTGSMPLSRVNDILARHHQLPEQLNEPPAHRNQFARQIAENEIYLIHRETAQAQVRIEFPDELYDESLTVPASLYNSYFGSGMSSVVFQELREARALAYSAAARYAQGSRTDSETLMLGVIGTQNDKAVDALQAFVDLIDNMPQSAERFNDALGSQINLYRTSTASARQIPGMVRSWERLGMSGDPRPQRFEQLQQMSFEDVLQFQRNRVADRPKLISIVGDTSRMDIESLEQLGTVRELRVDDVFVD